ncbi:hypothetical protein PtA15_6A196 [Puccinia triticina]|uniref:Zinc finger C2HC5-type domain-containing protein n=1 Tax=Puccinia triticina TaxID=208348 RepID=A0ABY7CK13_9BASI|nr:uncharacterized protein PtA15_6A196 [Puccinia triticina]WAQ85568.1 hypothetical protein PtA15_6A196 [Puccinia triticina]
MEAADVDLLASLETGYRSRQRRTTHSTSLSRRLLAAQSQASAAPPAPASWRHAYIARMSQELDSLGRTQAVSRLRQRMNRPPPPPDTLSCRQTYLLYCGNTPAHHGCRKLISARAVPVLLPRSVRAPTPTDGDATDGAELQTSLLSSDSLPFPNAAGRVDSLTQRSFQDDPANPFSPASPLHLACTCQKAYLGCLSCGNIVGHTITLPCDQCGDLPTAHPHFFYLSHLTAVPRYTDVPILLEAVDRPEHGAERPGTPMSWMEASRRKKTDGEMGLAELLPAREPLAVDASVAASPGPMSDRVRTAILLAGLGRPALQPSPPSVPLRPEEPVAAPAGSSLRRTALARRPALRLSLLAPTRPLLRPRTAPSSSESWVVRQPPAPEGFPPELLRLRRPPHPPALASPSTASSRGPPVEAKDDDDDDDDDQAPLLSIILPAIPPPRPPRRQRPTDDLDELSLSSSLRPASGRAIRRRVRPPQSSSSPPSSASAGDPQWIGHLCAR